MESRDTYQCPTCGRMTSDWSDAKTKKLSGKLTKVRQRKDVEDRAHEYRKWRRGFGRRLYVSDIDHLECRVIHGTMVPVAALELTRVDGNVKVPQSYLDAIYQRFTKRDGQGAIITRLAELLNIKAWVVLFRWDLTEFWVYNLTDERGWWKSLSPQKYKGWISSLHPEGESHANRSNPT